MPEGIEISSRGTIESAGRGKWRLRISTGFDPVKGKYGRVSRTVRGSKADAIHELERFRQELREPKSDSSKRWISLNDETVDALRSWKTEQERRFRAFNEEQSLKIAAAGLVPERFPGVPHDGNSPVVSNEVCGFTDPNVFARWFRKFCADNGFGTYESVERVRDESGVLRYVRKGYRGLKFHELRHTQATLLIGNGADIKTVQHRLGHSTASLTMDIYAHAIRQHDEEAAETIGGILTGEAAATSRASAADAEPKAVIRQHAPSDTDLVRDFFARRGQEASTGGIRKATGIASRKRLARVLDTLVAEGFLAKSGKTKGTRYRRI